jgi:prepilin-type N-terminal cleavage/methylation domain-containing protein
MREVTAPKKLCDPSGYSLPELMIVLAITGVLAGMASFQIGAQLKSAKGDSGMRIAMAQLNAARELAVAQRRIMLVKFLDPGVGTCDASAACVQIVRQELVVGTTTVLSTVPFEGGALFNQIAAVTADSPDAFGSTSAKCFGFVSTTGPPPTAVCTVTTGYGFNTDGSFIDTATGNPLNGTVFLSIPNTPLSYRSVTILGATGRVRAYRWDGRSWNLV